MYIYTIHLNYETVIPTNKVEHPKIIKNNIFNDLLLLTGFIFSFIHIILTNAYIFDQNIKLDNKNPDIPEINILENKYVIVISLYTFVIMSICALILNTYLCNYSFWLSLLINIIVLKILHFLISYLFDLMLQSYHNHHHVQKERYPEIINLLLIDIFIYYDQIYAPILNFVIIPKNMFQNTKTEVLALILYIISYVYPVMFVLYIK